LCEKGCNVVNRLTVWFKLTSVKLLKYWIHTQYIMKTTKHQLIIHKGSKETKTNSYCDLFLDCVGVKCISYNESCISRIDVKKVIWLSILSIWSVFNECYSRNVSFYQHSRKWDNREQIAVVQTPLINVVNQLYSDYGSFFSLTELLTIVTWRMTLDEEELYTLPDNLS
jgi:hypothetical protein